MSKNEVIQKYGKHDGNDELRWNEACKYAQEIDRHPSICFRSLINLEEKGYIALAVRDECAE